MSKDGLRMLREIDEYETLPEPTKIETPNAAQ